MPDTQDYGEPWDTEPGVSDIVNRDGYQIAGWCSFGNGAYQDRAISCVNACRGISNPEEVVPLINELPGYIRELPARTITACVRFAALVAVSDIKTEDIHVVSHRKRVRDMLTKCGYWNDVEDFLEGTQ